MHTRKLIMRSANSKHQPIKPLPHIMKPITALLLVFGLFAVLPSHAATNDALIATDGVIIEYPADMTVTK